MPEEIITHNADETRKFGKELASRLKLGTLLTLSGPLGAGKTTLVQGLAEGLGVPEGVTSPTFVIIIEHEGKVPLLHLDAYRLESLCFDAIRESGVPEFLDRDDAIKVVEWPQRIVDFLPVPDVEVEIELCENDNDRRICLTSNISGASS
ncbi:MAG: tRNA (adenosine(37)-N6)-threonylcarbamoyltransferase complex ATPase subunit type 1 TsaE [Abditibacteriaceae bacterium]